MAQATQNPQSKLDPRKQKDKFFYSKFPKKNLTPAPINTKNVHLHFSCFHINVIFLTISIPFDSLSLHRPHSPTSSNFLSIRIGLFTTPPSPQAFLLVIIIKTSGITNDASASNKIAIKSPSGRAPGPMQKNWRRRIFSCGILGPQNPDIVSSACNLLLLYAVLGGGESINPRFKMRWIWDSLVSISEGVPSKRRSVRSTMGW